MVEKKSKTVKKSPAKKAPAKKAVAKKPKATIANNKSKIAAYKPKKGEKYMSAAMKKHLITTEQRVKHMQIQLIEPRKKKNLHLS